MTGRAAALDLLREELERSAAGKRFLLIDGEPGIGKTRLVSEFAAEAHEQGSAVLYGRADDGLAKAYLPFIEAFGHCLEHTPADVLDGFPGELAELSTLLPEASERLGESTIRKDSPASEQFALFKSALSLLRIASREAPVVVVLEDLQWADEASLLMLQYLNAGRGDFNGVVVLTYRATDLVAGGAPARALARLASEPEVSSLALSGLSEGETLSLLHGIAGPGVGEAEPGLATAIRAEAAGNPLFASELIRSLVSDGALREVEGRWRLQGEIDAVPAPPTLLAAVGRRLDGLGEGAADALRLAAVAGAEFDPGAVGSALGREAGEAVAIWEAAERAALVAPTGDGGRLYFTCPLVRRLLVEGIGAGARAELERRLEASPRREDGRSSSSGVLENCGDHWLIRLDGELRLKDGKGIRYLARLLASPGVEIHAMDLQGGAPGAATVSPAAAAAAGLSAGNPGSEDAGPVLDAEAKAAYRSRVEELEAEIEEAEGFNDPERAALAREELEFIGRELAAAVGLGGRDRRAASQAERARVNVTRAIRGTLDRIGEHDERLGGRLRATVRTGAFCRYEPLAGEEIAWRVSTQSQ